MEANGSPSLTRPGAPPPMVDEFREGVLADAQGVLMDILGGEKGARAAAHVSMAFAALAKTQPRMRECARDSIINAIAMCALTGLMPGGALPGVYVLPRERRFNDGKDWKSVYELNFQVGFRGLLTLAQRAGYQVCAYPVYEGSPVTLDDRDRLVIPTTRQRTVRHWDRMIGVVVTAHRLADGVSLGRFFVEADLIEARRDASDSYKRGIETRHTSGYNKGKAKSAEEIQRAQAAPWFQWPEEMALKTALTYVIRRGYVPVDDAAEQVLRADAEADRPTVLDTTATVVESGRAVKPNPLRLPQNDTEPRDFAAENERLAESAPVESGSPIGPEEALRIAREEQAQAAAEAARTRPAARKATPPPTEDEV